MLAAAEPWPDSLLFSVKAPLCFSCTSYTQLFLLALCAVAQCKFVLLAEKHVGGSISPPE